MSSQDTLKYAESEEEIAKSLQSELEKTRAKINALQNDVNRESQIASSLETKIQEHASNGERLRGRYHQEQEQEQAQAQRERQQEDKQSLIEKAAEATDLHGLF